MSLTTDMDTTPTVTTTERGLLMLMLMPRLFTEPMDILTVLDTTLDTLDTDTLATPTPTVLVSPPPTPPSVTPWPTPLAALVAAIPAP